jgi:hypothetical protein
MSTPVASGPGALSRRTDTGPAQKIRELPDADYGEGATYKDLQKGAALGQSDPTAESAYQGNPAAANVIPFSAPTQDPNTPVTAGADAGAGPGAEALGLVSHSQQDMESQIRNLPVLEYMANQEGAPWALRQAVRRIKAAM